jgi:hypothetical protein
MYLITSFLFFALLCRLYEDLQNVPPQYDQLLFCPVKDDPGYQAGYSRAMAAFHAAALSNDRQWRFVWWQGRCARKVGEPPAVYLGLLARACHLASIQPLGLLDPLYSLHSARLKLLLQQVSMGGQALCSSEKRLEVLQDVGRYCFRAETQNVLAGLAEASGAGPSESWQLGGEMERTLLEDCMMALRWCLDKKKLFHPASRR